MPVSASRTLSPSRVLSAERDMTGGISDSAAIAWNAEVSGYETISTVRPAARIIAAVR